MPGARRSVAILRAMLLGLVFAYAAALYLEWHPPQLSAESTEYRQRVWQSVSGFSVWYAVQKIGLVAGSGLGLLGAILLFVRRRRGLPLLVLSAPVVVIAMWIGAPPATYPDVNVAATALLWGIASALWGALVAYIPLQQRALFERGER